MGTMCDLTWRTSPPHFFQSEETELAQYGAEQTVRKTGMPPVHSPSAPRPIPIDALHPGQKAAKTDRNAVHRRNVAGGASRNGAHRRPTSQTVLNMNIRIEALCTHAHLGRQG